MAGTRSVEAGPKIYVGDKRPKARIRLERIDHSSWNRLLAKYVDQNGLVDYRGWQATADDVQTLDRYLQHLSSAELSQNDARAAKLAFWINAYNSVTLRGILRHYPTSSIRNHTAKLYGYNIWKDLLLPVAGKDFSLDDMEHAILRQLNEPRIHFAVVCASRSCPRLLNEAYVPNRVEQQLARNTKDFFSRSQNFRFEPASNRMYLSAILKWYGGDFGKNQREQIQTLAPWLPSEAARRTARKGSPRVSYLTYDWSINEQTASGPPSSSSSSGR